MSRLPAARPSLTRHLRTQQRALQRVAQAAAQGPPVVDGAWTDYVPVWAASTTNPTLNNGTITGRWSAGVGNTIHFWWVLTIGSTTTLGSGNYTISLPVPAIDFNAVQCVGMQLGPHRGLVCRGSSTTTLYLNLTDLNPATAMTHANSALVAGSRVQGNGTYERA